MPSFHSGSDTRKPTHYLSVAEAARLDKDATTHQVWLNEENTKRLLEAAQSCIVYSRRWSSYNLTTGEGMTVELRGPNTVYARPIAGFVPCGRFQITDLEQKLKQMTDG